MNQIAPLFAYLCAALIVPVLVARFIVRAHWRTIRNSCMIWYSFLVLVFNGLFNPAGLGWAMIFAMYFSLLAIPLLSLAFRFAVYLRKFFVNQFRAGPSL